MPSASIGRIFRDLISKNPIATRPTEHSRDCLKETLVHVSSSQLRVGCQTTREREVQYRGHANKI